MACCLIHNYIRTEMVVDPISEQHLDEYLSRQENEDEPNNVDILGNQMEGAGVVGGQDGEKGKAARGWRTWSKIEEDALIQCLTDIVNNGWKTDNGFKPGFQRELKKGMKKLLPGTDLVENPHINSKIHVWKKEYGSLFDLLSKSGICWNCTTNTIDVIDEEAWETQKKADPHVKTCVINRGPTTASGRKSLARIGLQESML
ncbi:hypothetical protein ACS0TY_031439 [Phlomoides rotata]